ncbi:hypothetical protein M427DRAFT_135760 [Gonapodya prolifera JEL478]|uniref:Uncharacterized protein n=1 Tax=Gonapodya prolifera (strain JEL478) TaxID=1344416 RepID=A0A139ACS9_GONPJ|nr:hypothetical protein M427DRAFT_135760 [Gonapodya prolifera JEL478]|eukprot:KXS14384.1 hypothetical protein M427DRAFT_135760 [Gonapodya prolifera JEL478]
MAGGRSAGKDKTTSAHAAARHDARERNYESLVKKYGARLRMGDDLPSPSSTSSTSQSVPGSLSLHDQRATTSP